MNFFVLRLSQNGVKKNKTLKYVKLTGTTGYYGTKVQYIYYICKQINPKPQRKIDELAKTI